MSQDATAPDQSPARRRTRGQRVLRGILVGSLVLLLAFGEGRTTRWTRTA
ncbi:MULTISPECIES: hypothetical protein [unclassified Streptomyces]|nr:MULTISPECIES: hypothetical protein [unclassified Streptomyces]MCX4528670.1 hypothetical protein [Streptomyces sp. NBC_01551]MCX4540723.1 hypothetical protein [Streptomyces sp. NBC_01565]